MSFESFQELLRHSGVVVRPKVAVVLYALGWFISLFIVAVIGATFYALAANRWFPSSGNNSNAQAMLTDEQICAQTKILTDSMETFQNNMTASDTQIAQQLTFDQLSEAYIQLDEQQTYDFRTTLLPEAISLRDDLLQRIATSSVPTTTPDGTPTDELIAFEGQLAGPSPVGDAAVYLGELAHQLCPSQ